MLLLRHVDEHSKEGKAENKLWTTRENENMPLFTGKLAGNIAKAILWRWIANEEFFLVYQPIIKAQSNAKELQNTVVKFRI